MNPPIAPTSTSGINVARSPARSWFQLQAAVAAVHSSRIPVLFTVPGSVIVSPVTSDEETERNALSFSAGLEVRKRAILFSLHQDWHHLHRVAEVTRRRRCRRAVNGTGRIHFWIRPLLIAATTYA